MMDRELKVPALKEYLQTESLFRTRVSELIKDEEVNWATLAFFCEKFAHLVPATELMRVIEAQILLDAVEIMREKDAHTLWLRGRQYSKEVEDRAQALTRVSELHSEKLKQYRFIKQTLEPVSEKERGALVA